MTRSLPVEIANESLTLFAEGAAFWHRRGSLFVADVHLGKAAAFRSAGIPIPHGTTADDLQRLSRLLAQTGARTLIVLGDLVHSRSGLKSKTVDEVAVWRSAHPDLEIVLVLGNHDVASGGTPAEWRINSCVGSFSAAPFLCVHHLESHAAAPAEGFVFLGHVHPKIRLGPIQHARRATRCFILEQTRLVFPAFGSFTGGTLVRLSANHKYFPLVDGEIFSLPVV